MSRCAAPKNCILIVFYKYCGALHLFLNFNAFSLFALQICSMYKIFKPLLFKMSPEKAHYVTMRLFNIALKMPLAKTIFKYFYAVENKKLTREVLGLTFPNPIGLAAGFDKDGKYFEDLQHLGFGFIEIGTVTPKAQAGNPTPRLFRLPADEALINRMGFNNEGADFLAERLTRLKQKNVLLGINIGKNKTTPNDTAEEDYLYCFEKLFMFADYFVVNVSSPNTPDLRALQEAAPLKKLLSILQTKNSEKATPKPILLKIAPDLNIAQLNDVVDIVRSTKIAGVIATNTTIERGGLNTEKEKIDAIGAGGLSGKPVKNKSTEIIQFLRQKLDSQYIIIGVGGIQTGEDALEKLQAGADLVQVYSGLVYEGPAMIKKINNFLLNNF
jgi:dihydroorotate dehydrogenase